MHHLPSIENLLLISQSPKPMDIHQQILDKEIFHHPQGSMEEPVLCDNFGSERNDKSDFLCFHKRMKTQCMVCNRPPSRGGRELTDWLQTKKQERLKHQRPPDDL